MLVVRLCACAVFAVFLLPGGALAQGRVTIRGVVVTAESKAPVAGAVITAGSNRDVTDTAGRFTLAVTQGPVRVRVTASGFVDAEVDVIAAAEGPAFEIALTRTPSVREVVSVSADTITAPTTPATITLPPSAVLRVAGAGDNIFKTLQTLPGISATDDFGSRLAVRGGGPDQNLTVMDGVEIHNPYRLFGLTSAFNPETIDRFELTAGGFGAEYGDRLSSLLVVENRAGSTRQAFTGSGSLSLTDGNIVLEGKLPGQVRGSWLVTGRRTYYDLVADRITGNDLPSFNDVQAKGVWEITPGHELNLFGLRSRERTDATFTDDGDEIAVGDDSKNDLVSMNYRALIGGKATSRTTVAWYTHADDLRVTAAVRDGARRSNGAGVEAEQRADIIFTRALAVRDVSVREQVDIQAGHGHVVSGGVDFHALETTWGWTIAGDRNDSVANGSSIIGGTGLPSLLASRRDTTRAAGWLTDRWQATARLAVAPGLRVDRSGVNAEVLVSPRLSMALDLGARTRLKTAAGRFTQSPGYEKLLQSDYFVDLTSTTAARLTSERSTHVIAGLEHALTSSVSARFEAYSKSFDRLIVGRLESPEETAARVARYDFPSAVSASVPSAPQITSIPINGASGRAHGFDLYVEKRQASRSDRFSGWASYAWGRADITAYGITRPFDYDRRHSLSVVSTVGISQRLDVGATLRLASGFPSTRPLGLRVAADDAPDGSGRLVPAADSTGLPVWAVDFGDVSNLSRGRLPVYARLDLRATFTPKNPAGRWEIYVEVLNALNRKNVSRLEPELEHDPTSDRPRIEYAADTGLPLLPSFGFRYRF